MKSAMASSVVVSVKLATGWLGMALATLASVMSGMV